MSDYSRTAIGSGYNTSSAINSELTKIETSNNSKMDKTGGAFTGDVDMNSNSLLNVAQGVAGTDAVNLNQLNGVSDTGTPISTSVLVDDSTAGQTVFTTPVYVLGTNNLSVYINGQKQIVSRSYTETSTTSITFTTGLNLNDEVEFIVNERSVDADAVASTSVTYTPLGTGASISNVGAKLNEYISVTDFGAVGDGVTDDGPAFVAAYAAMNGHTIYIPRGTYLVSDLGGNLNAAGTHWVGESRFKTIIKAKGSYAGTAIFKNNSGSSSAMTSVENLTIDLNDEDIIGVDLSFVNTSIVNNVYIVGGSSLATATGTGVRFDAPSASGSYSNEVFNPRFHYLSKGIWWDDDANHNNVWGGEILGCSVGLDSLPTVLGQECDTLKVFGTRVEGCSVCIRESSQYASYYNVRLEGAASDTASTAIIEFHPNSDHPQFFGGSLSNATRATGSDDASSSAAFMTDLGESWSTNQFVGSTIYNTTDGSSAVITANTGTTVTGVLSGGLTNVWNSGDSYSIGIAIAHLNKASSPLILSSDLGGVREIENSASRPVIRQGKQVFGPRAQVASGSDDTSSGAAFMTDSGESYTVNEFVGDIIHNLTDNSSGYITANTGTTVTAVLSGGTNNDWDSGDSYTIERLSSAPASMAAGDAAYFDGNTLLKNASPLEGVKSDDSGTISLASASSSDRATIGDAGFGLDLISNGTVRPGTTNTYSLGIAARVFNKGYFTSLVRGATEGITAFATGGQGSATQLTGEINQISTVGTTGDSVKLLSAEKGLKMMVINDGANACDVFPSSGDDLGAGVDTAVSLAAGANITYASYNATNWVAVT